MADQGKGPGAFPDYKTAPVSSLVAHGMKPAKMP